MDIVNRYSGNSRLSLMDSSMQLDTSGKTTDYSAAWGIGASVVNTGINIWSSLALADQQDQMRKQLQNYNNQMRAISNTMRGYAQGVKMYAADQNRISVGDENTNTQMQIELDAMRAEAQTQVQAAFLGASGSAKAAALYDIDRNAITAKVLQQGKFEHALKAIQLQEFSDNLSINQQFQGQQYIPEQIGVSPLGETLKGVGELAQKSMKSGAWDKGSPLRNTFADLFNNNEAKLPD